MRPSHYVPEIYDFVDSREFLRAYYIENKRRNPHFSFRTFSSRAGIKSFNYLKYVIEGQRRLTQTFFEPFCKALALDEARVHYFSTMLQFAEAKDPVERRDLFEKLVTTRPPSTRLELTQPELLVCQAWHYIPILELTESLEWTGDLEWMAERLRLETGVVESALGELEAAGLLVEVKGILRRSYTVADTSRDKAKVPDVHIRRYHLLNVQRSLETILVSRPEERELSSITTGIDETKLHEIKQILQETRERIFQVITQPNLGPTRVYQANFQLLPIEERK